MRRLISSGSVFEAAAGYSRAVVEGEWVFVAGTTGFDYSQMTIADDAAEQARQALRNIEAALAEAGATLADIVRVRYYLPDLADWPKVVSILGEVFGAIRPAATALICGLIDSRMKIEIEVTARRRGQVPDASEKHSRLCDGASDIPWRPSDPGADLRRHPGYTGAWRHPAKLTRRSGRGRPDRRRARHVAPAMPSRSRQ
jgi:enamine deaminase RidA (YjgF/YER057c/UK114 family)